MGHRHKESKHGSISEDQTVLDRFVQERSQPLPGQYIKRPMSRGGAAELPGDWGDEEGPSSGIKMVAAIPDSSLASIWAGSGNLYQACFRIEVATSAAARALEDSIIKTLGRWKSLAYLQ